MVGVEKGREFCFRGDLYSQESTFPLVLPVVVLQSYVLTRLCFYCLCSRMLCYEYYIGGVPSLRSRSCWVFCCATRSLCTSPHGATALRFVLSSCQDTTSDDRTLPSPTMTRMYRADSQALHRDGRRPLIRA